MKRFLHCDNGFVDQDHWLSDSWINIESPDADDLRFLVDELGVPQVFLDDLADIDERPRFDSEGDWLLTILRVPMADPAGEVPYITVPVGIFTNGSLVVTVCYHKTVVIDDFINFSRRKSLVINTQQDFVLRILFSATFWFLTYLKDINAQVKVSEQELRRSVQNRDLMMMMRLQNSLVYFNTSIHGNASLLERQNSVFEGEYDMELLDDLQIEMKQADITVSTYIEILSSIMDTYGSIVSNNINDIMKRMTSITIILMVPTLIASLYGMNVDSLLLADAKGSFYIIVGVAIVLTIATYLLLRKIKWF